MKHSPELNGYVRQIWKLIEEEVLANMKHGDRSSIAEFRGVKISY